MPYEPLAANCFSPRSRRFRSASSPALLASFARFRCSTITLRSDRLAQLKHRRGREWNKSSLGHADEIQWPQVSPESYRRGSSQRRRPQASISVAAGSSAPLTASETNFRHALSATSSDNSVATVSPKTGSTPSPSRGSPPVRAP